MIDLTFANETAVRQGVVGNHTVNPDLAILSDHHALMFTLGNLRELVDNITEARYNWKDTKEEDFVEALVQELHTDAELFEKTIQQVLNKHQTQATPDELDNAVRFINTCMERAAEKTVPTSRICSCSKPWWNSSLTEAFKEMRTAREMAKSYYHDFN